ncbi:MAG: TRAP transporter substrate-binding protein [Burkholderiales bacterium]
MAAGTNTFRYICSHDMRVENPLHIRLTEMFEAVRRETGGQLEVEIVPWGGTGPSKLTLTKLLEGDIAFHPVSGMPLSTLVPIAAMEGLPFAFDSEEEACRVMDSEFGDLLRKEIAAKGLIVFPRNWPQGNNQITSSTKPIRTVEDLDGFKLRTAQVPYKVDLFSSLGCKPQQIYYQAVYDSLKSGAASGQETPYLYIEMDRFVEVQKYLSVTHHRMGNFWLCANPGRWHALPRDVQQSVERNADKYVELFRADMVRANAEAAERLKSRLEFNVADTSGFVARLKDSGFYARWRKEFGERAWTLLEEKRGRPLP